MALPSLEVSLVALGRIESLGAWELVERLIVLPYAQANWLPRMLRPERRSKGPQKRTSYSAAALQEFHIWMSGISYSGWL